ncbi:MAG: oligogalacturonate lyase family protein [Verrucomicrobia bacterium]|nr:oligogalacturonate lyase family protein [Verrucomicrobiota bacterium]
MTRASTRRTFLKHGALAGAGLLMARNSFAAAGQRFPSERRELRDEKTGARLWQMTAAEAMHHHFYFTNPSWPNDQRELYFVSYRTGFPNLFAAAETTGEITQLTARADINPFSPTVTRDGRRLYFSARDCVVEVDRETLRERVVAKFDGAKLGNCSLNAVGTRLAIGVRLPKCCRLALIELASGQTRFLVEKAEVGHIQFCPADDNILEYSGTPGARIWTIRSDGSADCNLYPQQPGEWIVHESWLGDGSEIIFTHWPRALRAVSRDGARVRTVAAFNSWHESSDHSGRWIVADTNHPDIGLQRVNARTGERRTLCHPNATSRGTQWTLTEPARGAGIDTSIIRGDRPELDRAPRPDDPASVYGPQWSHPHPAFSPDGRRVVFTSDRGGWSQVYVVECEPPKAQH